MTIRSNTATRNLLLLAVAIAMSTGCTSGRPFGKACTDKAAKFKLKIKLKENGSPKEVRHDYIFGSNADEITVCPGDRVTWRQHDNKKFSITFNAGSPVGTPNQSSAPDQYKVESVADAIRENAPDGRYKYDVTIPGTPEPVLDPIIIVDR
jgi:plastocyanin